MSLPKTKEELTDLILKLMGENQQLRQRVKELEELLKRRKVKPPPTIKPNPNQETGSGEKKPRKKRQTAHVRKRATQPDQTVYHATGECPDCRVKINGKSMAYDREVIDIPMPPAITTRHIVLKRKCWRCGKTWIPQVDLSDQVVGKSRLGVNLTGLTNFMTEWLRVPIDKLQEHLRVVYQLDISAGALVELRYRAAHRGAKNHRQLRNEVRGSQVINADETGHREDGVNKYIWTFANPQIRYFLYQRGRSQEVVREVLGDEFDGVLCSDFYASYNVYPGYHQRCWAHLLDDIKTEVKIHADCQELKTLKETIKGYFDQGLEIQTSNLKLEQRHQKRRDLESQLLDLVIPYTKDQDHPFHTLAKRIDRHIDELFVYVLDPKIPATNNEAERSLRHNVISRKISGGTRSPCGSRTKEILASLFGTWHVRNLNPLQECKQLLTNPNYAIPPPPP
jgi:transposase